MNVIQFLLKFHYKLQSTYEKKSSVKFTEYFKSREYKRSLNKELYN